MASCANCSRVALSRRALLPALLKAVGWQETEQGPVVAPESILHSGTNLELAQHWIETQPMVAAHWADAAALHAKLEAKDVAQDGPGILASRLHAEGAHKDMLYVDGGPSTTGTVGKLRMKGRAFTFAVHARPGVAGFARGDLPEVVRPRSRAAAGAV